ncbi:MAG: hypothetical protein R6V58_12545 [Planctomycetota bacterium]
MRAAWRRVRRAFARKVLSPKCLLFEAGWLWLGFGVAHACGLRRYVGIISGTLEPAHPTGCAVWGAMYAALYFAAVLLAPILLISSGLALGCHWLLAGGRGVGSAGGDSSGCGAAAGGQNA